jgi:N-acetylglucosamine repressor
MRHGPIDSRSAGIRNENLILTILRQNGRLSQAQLCRQAGLSSSTTSYIIGRLREKGLIIEQRGQSNSRGAKPVILNINPVGRFAVGVEINPNSIFMGLFNFNCELIESVRTSLADDHSPENAVKLLEITIRGLLGKHGIAEEKVTGIGIVVSGSISNDGVVQLSSPLGWKGIPLRSMLQSQFAARVSIHTTRVRLLAENSVEQNISFQNMLYLNVGNGVSGHAIVDGHLIHGGTNLSGELGHIILDPAGPVCGCGHKGCLEAFIGGPALVKKMRNDIAAGTPTILTEQLSKNDSPETGAIKWGKALASKDKYAQQLRDMVGEYLSRAAAIAINCFDPDVVVLAGYVCEQCHDFLIERTRKRIESDVFDNLARKIRIVPARAGEISLILGVATAVLKNAMETATT